VLDAQCWARDPELHGNKTKRKSLPIEAKESNKWLKKRLWHSQAALTPPFHPYPDMALIVKRAAKSADIKNKPGATAGDDPSSPFRC